jgi:rare lipoprotein A
MGRMPRARSAILTVLAGLFLAGCASSGPQSGFRHYAVGRPHYTVAPYEVDGVWYYPEVDYNYDRSGTASWYGPGFDGRPTADGEIYDMNDLSAAHKTLPLPSVVEVTNLQNGRELTLRVNDRGPFIGDRLIDVSRRAAQLLGFERSGTAAVRVRILEEPSIQVAEAAMLGEIGPVGVAAARPPRRIELAAVAPPHPQSAPPPRLAAASPQPPERRQFAAAQPDYWPSLIAPAHAATLYPPPRRPVRAAAPAPIASRRIFIQAAAFSVPANARWARAQIARLGSAEIVPGRVHGVPFYRVQLGPVGSDAEALRLLTAVLERGFAGARVVVE